MLTVRQLTPLVLGPVLTLSACRSAEDHADDADLEVYEIVRDRREEITTAEEVFTIDPPVDTLRDRVLSGEATELPPLTLIDCLEIAAEGNRQYLAQREALYLTALDLTLERWNFAVQESGTAGAFLQRLGSQDFAGANGFLGFTKLFGTGLLIAGDIGLTFLRDISQGDGWDAVSNLSLSVTQPLVRGFGRHIVEEPLTQADRDVLYQARAYESFRRDLAVDVADRFFSTLERYDRVRNEEANVARRTALRERNEAFAEAGQVTNIDVDQTRQDELAAKDSLIEARRSLQEALDELKFFLGLPIDLAIDLDPTSRQLAGEWLELRVEIPEEVAVSLALERRFDYATTLDEVEDAERKAIVAADALRAGLDVSFNATALSLEGRPLDFRESGVVGSLAIDFDAPINRLPERNAYRASLVTLQAAERSAVEEADRLRTDVRDALRDLTAARESYDIQKNAVELGLRRVESSEISLEAGRAETRDVLESQNALVAAENDAAAAFTRFILAGIDLYRTMELLLVDEEGIELVTEPIEQAMRENP